MLGAVQENGPFTFLPNSTVFELNPYSWNNNANVIYFESPPGVGFSLATEKLWNDTLTAQANLEALIAFFQGWPSLRKNDFFISGESYAGIYVPYLATYVDNWNSQQPANIRINLKGIAVGNGCTDPLECNFQSDIDPFLAELLYD
jgi:serine carboxypeptidase-like clade 2